MSAVRRLHSTLNYNVLLTLLLRTTDGIASGIWNLAVFSTYISVLEGSTPSGNEKVGYAQAIQGSFLAATALPVGWLAGRLRRDRILKVAGLVQLCAIATLSVAGLGTRGPILDSLFADSVATGARSSIYTIQYICSILSQGLGPAIAALVFYLQGNEWKLGQMREVMLVGMALAVVPAIILNCFDDRRSLGLESEGYLSCEKVPSEEQSSLKVSKMQEHDETCALTVPLLSDMCEDAGIGSVTEVAWAEVSGERSGHADPGCQGVLGLEPIKLASPPLEHTRACSSAQPLIWEVRHETLGQSQTDGQQAFDTTSASMHYLLAINGAVLEGEGAKIGHREQLALADERAGQFSPREPLSPDGIHSSLHDDSGQNFVRAEGNSPCSVMKLNSLDTGPSGGECRVPVIEALKQRVEPAEGRRCCPWLTVKCIPPLLAISDCMMGLASGMTIKYFPIFFKDEVGLPPLSVNLMYCLVPVGLSLASFTGQRLSRVIGRVQVMVTFKILGILLLFAIASFPHLWLVPSMIMPMYICRTCIINCCYPLQKSILMDFVPKEMRTQWNSLESVTSFGWSGSAAVGGWLIHRYGYGMTFHITASFQLMAWTLLLWLLALVPVREVTVVLDFKPADNVAANCSDDPRPGAKGCSTHRTESNDHAVGKGQGLYTNTDIEADTGALYPCTGTAAEDSRGRGGGQGDVVEINVEARPLTS